MKMPASLKALLDRVAPPPFDPASVPPELQEARHLFELLVERAKADDFIAARSAIAAGVIANAVREHMFRASGEIVDAWKTPQGPIKAVSKERALDRLEELDLPGMGGDLQSKMGTVPGVPDRLTFEVEASGVANKAGFRPTEKSLVHNPQNPKNQTRRF